MLQSTRIARRLSSLMVVLDATVVNIAQTVSKLGPLSSSKSDEAQRRSLFS
jgi:hypothetical protein